MVKLFGTDGVRGVAGKYPVDFRTVANIGNALGFLLMRSGKGRHIVVVGRDTRESCDMLESALLSGLLSAGVDIALVGVVPTPAVSFIIKDISASAGVMISASHNYYTDNGMKIFNHEGFKQSISFEQELQGIIEKGDFYNSSNFGVILHLPESVDRYADFLVGTVKDAFFGMKVVLDSGNGAAYKVAGRVFELLGATVLNLGAAPNGKNINLDCGSVYPSLLSSAVVGCGADIGFAFDGDSDRVVMCDEKGVIKSGDQMLAIIATYNKSINKLAKSAVVGTFMSGICLEEYLKNLGIDLIRASIGDRYVSELMRKNGYTLGGEESGHIVLGEYLYTGDGILAAIHMCKVMKDYGCKTSEMFTDFVPFPRLMLNIACCEDMDNGYSIASDLAREAELSFEDKRGRVLVRKSGTEKVIRVMVESEDKFLVDSIACRFREISC